jgi:hypothetical protein
MILVLETNGCLLHLFSSVTETESHLEAIDIGNREYEFCDDTGQRFVGEIISPVTRFRRGRFRLIPAGAPDTELLASFLARARSLERGCGEVQTLDGLRSSFPRAKS